MILKHFVTFMSPGTFVIETTTKEIDAWDVETATAMARDIVERYSATPYGFYFTTRVNDGELDSRETAKSPKYFLGGEVLTLKDVVALNDPGDRILISNMRINNIARVVRNTNSWQATLSLDEGDVVLDFDADRTKRGGSV